MIPNSTYIAKDENSMPEHKPMKDRITILVCADACGDCKIRPMAIYYSENSKIFERHNVMKSKLPAMWQSNPKPWCARQFFVEWVYEKKNRKGSCHQYAL